MEITLELELAFWIIITILSVIYLGIGTLLAIIIDFLDETDLEKFNTFHRILTVLFWPLVTMFYIVFGR